MRNAVFEVSIVMMWRLLVIAAWWAVGVQPAATGAEISLPEQTGPVGQLDDNLLRVGFRDEAPRHEAGIAGLHAGVDEVTLAAWRAVVAWGLTNGYDDLPAGEGLSAEHPVTGISWYDAVKWCNARSMMEDRDPVYFHDEAFADIYRTGEVELSNRHVNWSGTGYRLPTDREWELLARGGVTGQDFPWAGASAYWAENISSAQANYASGGPVQPGQFDANPYGLNDMAGNVAEWCWDWYAPEWYAVTSNHPAWLPRGPDAPGLDHQRSVRGGSWRSEAADLRVAARGFASPASRLDHLGFRVVRTDVPPAGVDGNQDGIEDRWMIQYFSHAGAAVADDPSASEVHNVKEAYIAGFDPADTGAVFRVRGVEIEGGIELIWPSAEGRRYSVYRAKDPGVEQGLIMLAGDVAATPPQNVFKDVFTPPMLETVYYLISVEIVTTP
jgi:formylglycine-generating enzyme required for sulfatase activity